MSKPAYNIGDLVAARLDKDLSTFVIGWITKIEDNLYYVEWSDGPCGFDTERDVEIYVKLYKQVIKQIHEDY